MRNHYLSATLACAVVIGLAGAAQVRGDTLLASFENTLATSVGTSFFHDNTLTPTVFNFMPTGATEGATALEVTHPPNWVTDIKLIGGQQLAELTAASTIFQFDVTTADKGVAGDALHPAWRQVFVIFNGGVGGWQQNQIDFGVAPDDGTSLTQTVFLDLVSSGIQANAAAAAAAWGEMSYWEIFLVFQGADSDSVPQIITSIDNMRFDGELAPGAAGDYNNDGMVDAADYTVWRDNVGGTTLTNETVSPGIVDDADYNEWKANFGGGAGALAAAGVPEPGALALILMAVCALVAPARRNNS